MSNYEIILILIIFILIAVVIYKNKKLVLETKKRKEIEDRLENETKKSDELLSVIPVPILITDKETRKIVFANDYSSVQYKIPKEELVGMSITDIYTSEDQGDEILHAMSFGIPLINFETKYKLLSGEEINALLSLVSIEYDNRPARMGSITDITDLKETQNELREEKDKALKAERAKSEFLANMSHEIRTPLNAILGFVGLLKDNEKDIEKLKYLTTVDDSSKSLLEIINDILDFSKIDSGKIDIERVDFDTFKEFETVAALFKAKFEEKDIDFGIDLDSKVPKYLNSDIQKLRQVISNLLSNAVKFTPHGKSVVLKIDFSDKKLYVEVRDEGIGIPKNVQANIFNAFSQADSSTTRKFGGTGLGLSISSSFIKLLGGKIKLESQENIGSKFYFSIPVEIGKEIINESETIVTFDLKGNILIVEDNKANQMFMKVILNKMKLDFDIACDGFEAVEAFVYSHTNEESEKYDAILMDENMPNMNGIEATKHILEYEKLHEIKHTPIIALTANALKGDRDKFLEAGMDEYLTKPIDKKELAKVLGAFLHVT